MTEEKETKTAEQNSNSVNPPETEQEKILAASDAWQVAEYSVHEEPEHDPQTILQDPLEIDKLLDESRTVIWAVKGTSRIRFVVRKLTATEMTIFLHTLFGITSFLEEKEGVTKEARIDAAVEQLQDMGVENLYDKILIATEAAIEEPVGVKAEMFSNWPEELVNRLTNAATGGVFGDTAGIRFLKNLDDTGRLLRGANTGQDSDSVSDTADGDSKEV